MATRRVIADFPLFIANITLVKVKNTNSLARIDRLPSSAKVEAMSTPAADSTITTLLVNATIATIDIADAQGDGPLAGPRQGDLGLVADGAVAIRGSAIVGIGARESLLGSITATEPELEDVREIDLGGRLVVPGFVDAHTHIVWAGDRAEEFERRIGGASYLEIMATGGGIASTVRATRAADDELLIAGVLARLDALMAYGATTVEVKTGYGLTVEEELRQLRVIKEADRRHPVNVVPTFLGAHALPVEYQATGRRPLYVDLIIEEMLPAVIKEFPAVFCDVFCDEGAFTLDETKRILGAAAALGLRTKVHSDEFANLGCTALAAETGAVSADHLVVTTTAEMEAMARAGTVAVVLPGTTIGLGSTSFANAREMVARGVPVALGSDFNPGTCPCPNLPLIAAIASRYCGLEPAQALVALTRNSAAALRVGSRAGRISLGRPADLVVLDTDDYRDLCYRFGGNPVSGVMIGGQWTLDPF